MATISGTNGDDVIVGTDQADGIQSYDGDDIIDGGAGNDCIDAGAGDDVITAGDGHDTVHAGSGDDIIYGGGEGDLLFGEDDADTFIIDTVGATWVHDTVVDGGSGGDDWDTLDFTALLASGWDLVNLTKTPETNGTPGFDGYVELFNATTGETAGITFTDIEHIVPCFTPGTRIATPKGEVPVESLRVGDKVVTRDNGLQEIRWVGRKDLGGQMLASQSHLRPVLIRAGALGKGLPERDMLVSPNHRVLLMGERPSLYFDEREVLASAKHLVDGKGIERVEASAVSYIHFMFDHHEVVLSDGAWTESFQPGDQALKGVGAASRRELHELFPELETATGRESFVAARRVLKRHEAGMLAK